MNTLLSGLWNRSLDRYPTNVGRIRYLALTVIATIALYYESLTLGSVAPLVQAHFHLSLSLYAYILILGTVLGALAALLGSFSDRVGRANLLVYGLLVTGVCTFAMALATSLRDKELVEARASHIDVDAVLKHPWHQMLRPRLVISALGIDLLLLMYFVARSFFVIFLSSSFKFPLAEANGIVSIFWVVIVVSAIIVGLLSDAILVRKAFMLIGTVMLIIATLLFISRIEQPTSTALVTILLALMGIGISIAYIPWLAAFTETVEDINPALVATGAAVEVFLARWVAIIATLVLTLVVGNGQGWGIWLWICVAGQVVFLPTILLVSGHWLPLRAFRRPRTGAQAEPVEVQPHDG